MSDALSFNVFSKQRSTVNQIFVSKLVRMINDELTKNATENDSTVIEIQLSVMSNDANRQAVAHRFKTQGWPEVTHMFDHRFKMTKFTFYTQIPHSSNTKD